ncbi:hypothetical protein ACH4HG_11345 [Streptomyces coeruleorubidus]|uniref:Uncharacterized protein n=1 Tax=Streptomyces coeruleorubidus TaxID=116188 RepID=A0ABZ0KCX8_STRC4|nr:MULTISPECIES: hypothetical protein [Streptomyces]WOT35829.1 hypothetical protein R5U08_17605 [Streptomyces coeruleorubidus]GGT84343.1 hypothetical protein GCM10010244_06490 [Streptomyces bellus]
MLEDPYAVLRALLRAEAVRNAPKPPPQPQPEPEPETRERQRHPLERERG